MNRTARFTVLAFAAALAACDKPAAPPASSAADSGTPVADAAPSSPQQLGADMDLMSKVQDALRGPGKGHVEVAASDGVVTLYGVAETPWDRDLLARVALNVEGVRSVVNNLVVIRSS